MKKCLALLLCLILLCAALPASALTDGELQQKLDAAFEADALKLVETTLPICHPAIDDLELSEGLLEYLKQHTDSEDPAAALKDSYSPENLQLLSLSPSGESALFVYAGMGVSMYRGKYHILYPAYEKGVEDTNRNLELYAEKYVMRRFSDMIGSEGIVYSPDGKYAAVYNMKISVYKSQFCIDPVIIDLSTGEMILTATYPNKLPREENAGAVTSACFSADSNTFYYTVYGNFGDNRIRMCRYDIASGTTATVLDTETYAWRPHLSLTAGGNFLVAIDSPRETGIAYIKNSGGGPVLDKQTPSADFNLFRIEDLRYSADSGNAVFIGGPGSGYWVAFQLVKPEEDFKGFDQYLSLTKDTNEIVITTAEEYRNTIMEHLKDTEDGKETQLRYPNKDYPYQNILNMILSPDGHYVLLNAVSQSADGTGRNLFLVRLDDLAVRKISGLDAGEIPVGAMAGAYQMNIEWNTENLIIGTNDGIKTYRFDD